MHHPQKAPFMAGPLQRPWLNPTDAALPGNPRRLMAFPAYPNDVLLPTNIAWALSVAVSKSVPGNGFGPAAYNAAGECHLDTDIRTVMNIG